MLRLVVNPGTDSAWEIPLSPGVISLGRAPDNSFPIEHPSVSSTHCQVTVTDAGVSVKDLGSVNGTFVDDAMVDEAPLVNGQTLRLGEVVMRFESDLIPRARPIPGVSPPPAFPEPSAAPVFCKFHPKVVAQFRCPKCQRSFCALCVSHRQGGYFCRACSAECLPLEPIPLVAAEPSFFKLAGGAFGYPLKGDGWMLLICGGILFTLIDAAKFLAQFAFIYGFTALVFLTVFGVGYLMRYLECIITDTARGENEMPDWPDLADFSSAVTGPFFQIVGLVAFCFSPAILLTIYALFAHEGGAWLGWATVAAFFFGALYFPMAFLAVAMFDSLAAVNPLLVIPSILKIPMEYALAIGLFIVIVLLRWLGQSVLPQWLGIPYVLPAIIGNFAGLCLLTVEARILGALYFTKKDELGWFGR